MPWSDGFVWPLPEPEHKPHAVIWTAHAVYESVAWIIPGPHADANARLIAAAPELLEAARLFVKRHAQVPAVPVDSDWPANGDTDCVCGDCSRFNRAIAKAEGRQP